MRILYLAHRIPYPPDKGDKLRAFKQLEHLARSHCVSCACFVDRVEDLKHVAVLESICERVAAIPLNPMRAAVRGLLGWSVGSTVTESYFRVSAMDAALREWCRVTEFDAVVAFSSSMAGYALAVPARRRVLDLCDLDSRKWLDYGERCRPPAGIFYRREGARLASRERAWIEAFDATLLITDGEAEPFRLDGADHSVHIVGNGVDIPNPDQVERSRPERRLIVGFMGTMDYRPNVDAVRWFVARCWPGILRAQPAAVFRIVGRSPTRTVRKLTCTPGVEVTGAVADAASEVAEFQVSVAPLRIARGLQNKVLEAMSLARPVVLTSGAAGGIAGRSGEEFLIADTAGETIDHVVRLLNDPAECSRVGSAGRRFVARHHRWEDQLRKFERLVTGNIVTTPGSCAAIDQSPKRQRGVMSRTRGDAPV